MIKRILSLGMCGILLALLAFSLVGCGETTSSTPSSGTTQSSTDTAGTTRTITDHRGRTVEIPAKIERIAPLGFTPRVLTYLGLADKFVGIQECEIAKSPIMAYAYPHREEWAKLPNTGTDSLGAGLWNAEVLIQCKPDVIITTYTADVSDDIQRQTGIPVVSVTELSDEKLFTEEYSENIRFLGEVCGVSERAEELIAYIDQCVQDVKNRTKDIPDDKKPTVLAAGATFSGAHSIDGIYANYIVFDLLAAKDVTKGFSESGGVLVDKEKILDWNPDILFFDANSMKLIYEDYQKDPSYFESLKAVKNGQMYQWPNSQWHSTNVEIPLVTLYYVGAMLYPEQFADVDFEKKASEIFDKFLGEPDYLKTLEEAGAGYGPVSLKK